MKFISNGAAPKLRSICSRDGTFFKFYSAPWAGWVTPTTPLQSPIILFLDIHEVFFLNMAHTIMAEIISTTKLKDLNGEYLEVVHIYMGLISWSAILFITKVTFFIELLGNSRLNIIFKNGDWASEPIDISWNNHESNRYRSWQWGFY